MDILDALEQQVSTLLQELADLKKENAQLKKIFEGKSTNGSDQTATALEKEQALKNNALAQRLDTLIARLEEQIITD